MTNTQDQLVAALRVYGGSHVQLTRAFADSLGMHSTDAAALSEIIYAEDAGSPISPLKLAKKLGLSKPALSACINRLEAAGHVQRTKEFADRRVVSLRCSPAIYQHAGQFFLPLSLKMDRLVSQLSEDQVSLIGRFLKDASQAISEIVP